MFKNYKIKTSFVDPESLKARDNKTGINLMIFILICVENWFILSFNSCRHKGRCMMSLSFNLVHIVFLGAQLLFTLVLRIFILFLWIFWCKIYPLIFKIWERDVGVSVLKGGGGGGKCRTNPKLANRDLREQNATSKVLIKHISKVKTTKNVKY